LDKLLDVSPCAEPDELYLLLPKNVRRSVGILASNIIDTETRMIELNPDIYRADGLMGTAIVRDYMTLFLDIHRLVERLEPEGWVKPAIPPLPAGRKYRVLLVEDTQFFRQVVKGFLEAAGFEVTTAGDGREGLAKLDAETFDLVVSDLEMPVLDGWEFAKAVRQNREDTEMPLMALTSLDNDRDRERAKAAGFDRYEVKLDRERLLTAVAAMLRERAGAVA
jgi:two-component system chemotaxis sensor kinase CheA